MIRPFPSINVQDFISRSVYEVIDQLKLWLTKRVPAGPEDNRISNNSSCSYLTTTNTTSLSYKTLIFSLSFYSWSHNTVNSQLLNPHNEPSYPAP